MRCIAFRRLLQPIDMASRIPQPGTFDLIPLLFLKASGPVTAQRKKLLILLLRVCGVIDLLALAVSFFPAGWIISLHGHLGMGPFPQETIAFYLARSTSLMYAVHGVLLILISFDVERYGPLLRWLAGLSIVQGFILIVLDLASGMPWWWATSEGGLLLAWGCVIWWMTGRETGKTGEN